MAAEVGNCGNGSSVDQIAQDMDLFISYSHKDRAWKDRVASFMHCMTVNGKFDYATWDDGEITPGSGWRDHILQAIDQCRLAILLISPDFLGSKFIIEEEIPRLLQLRDDGRVVILPVIVRPSPWEVVDWLAPIQLHPADGSALSAGSQHEIEENLKQIALEVNRLISASAVDESEEGSDGSKDESGYVLMTQEEVQSDVRARANSPVRGSLLIFATKSQRTWLVATASGILYCLLDSEKTRTTGKLEKWSMPVERATPVVAREKSRDKRFGLIDIGRRQNWFYTKDLHPDTQQLRADVVELIRRASVAQFDEILSPKPDAPRNEIYRFFEQLVDEARMQALKSLPIYHSDGAPKSVVEETIRRAREAAIASGHGERFEVWLGEHQ